MRYTPNALNILTTKSYKGIGNAWLVKNLNGNETVDTIVALLNKTIKSEPTTVKEFEQKRESFLIKLRDKLDGYCDGFVALGDPDFPQHRGNVKDSDKPVFLYYKGNIKLLSVENKNITVIGLLNPEGDIEERERRIVAEFVKNRATIISGLALGCDSIAHIEALESNGNTVAILPSSLTKILPSSNNGLAQQIVEQGGLLVTEYGKDFKSHKELISRYVERDRLQALFCDTIVLVASYAQDSAERWVDLAGKKLDSGAGIAMSRAKAYGIPRAVMYDDSLDKENPMFDLNREIIKDQNMIHVINNDNLSEIVQRLSSKQYTYGKKPSTQEELF